MGNRKRVAVFDGKGESSSVSLYWEDLDTADVEEIPWPEDFPSWVTRAFLESRGFECIRA